MLVIRSEQWSALTGEMLRDFVSRAAAHLRQVDTQHFALLDDGAQHSEIRHGIARARELGIVSERVVILFLETEVFFAADKNLQATHAEWARNQLSCEGCDPDRTMEYVHDAIQRQVRPEAALGENGDVHA